MLTTAIKVVAPVQPEVTALTQACEQLAQACSLDRFEIAVKSRLSAGIKDDNDLRQVDELLKQVAIGGDTVDAQTKPAISAAHALHKSLIAAVDPWKKRWSNMADSLKSAILSYRRQKEELARRQQAELDRAAAQERQRLELEARAAMRTGDVATAQAALQMAQSTVTPIITQATPVLDNSSVRRPWQVEITDPDAVVKDIAAGIIPLSAIKEFDLSFLKKEATKRGGLPVTWTGMKAWQEDRLSVSRR